MERLKLTEDLKKFIEERCTDYRFLNIVVYLQSQSMKDNAEVIDEIKKVNPEFSIRCMASCEKNEKIETTIVFDQTGFTGG
jgi:hypothetical protein